VRSIDTLLASSVLEEKIGGLNTVARPVCEPDSRLDLHRFVEATFQSSFVNAVCNGTAYLEGHILIMPRERISLVAAIRAGWRSITSPASAGTAGRAALVASSSYRHGNQKDANQAGRGH
jgi:hypothetical protein